MSYHDGSGAGGFRDVAKAALAAFECASCGGLSTRRDERGVCPACVAAGAAHCANCGRLAVLRDGLCDDPAAGCFWTQLPAAAGEE